MKGAVFGLWDSGGRGVLEAMGTELSHYGDIRHLHELGRALHVGVCGAGVPVGRRHVPAVCAGTITNACYLAQRFALSPSSDPGEQDQLIWQLYCRAGTQGLEHVDGSYQLALYDEDRHRLILATGRNAGLPICIARLRGGMVFGPELKALAIAPGLHQKIGRAALAVQLDSGLPSPKPQAARVRFVWPGQIGAFDADGERIEQTSGPELPFRVASSGDALADLRRAIVSTMRRMTSSAQRPGVVMSPGVGSLVCLGAARWVMPEQPLRTYAVVYGEDDPFGEFARRVARYFGTDHQEILLDPGIVRSLLAPLVWETEHPLGPERMLDHLLVARAAAGEVDLLLNGDLCFDSHSGAPRPRLGWRRAQAPALTPPLTSPHEVAGFERLHARAGASGGALFHDAEVRVRRDIAGPAVQSVYSASKKAVCAIGAGFVPARLFEDARRYSRYSNDSFSEQMARTCADLLTRDSLALRGMPGAGTGHDNGADLMACRCLPGPLWSRAMLEMWCRLFVDGSARGESDAASMRALPLELASNVASERSSIAENEERCHAR